MLSILETAREKPHILLRPDQIGPAPPGIYLTRAADVALCALTKFAVELSRRTMSELERSKLTRIDRHRQACREFALRARHEKSAFAITERRDLPDSDERPRCANIRT